ncbi:hypothetical protein TKK_0015640 [Trichogramma kaykai]
MEKEKISSDFAPPYTPELNGMAERFNKTIQKKITAMMIDSGLPASMWMLAAEATTHVYNRTPHKGLSFKTPLSMINENIKSHISELKRFGCLSYIKIPVAENKFSEKAIVAYLVGHTPTGYLMWHPQTNRFITSRHVQFNEKVVYQDRVRDQENDKQTKKIIEQLVFESEPITFEANKIDEKIEHATPEVIETPKRKAITTKQKNIPEPRRMPERRATKQKLMDPNFVYKAKVPELKIDDIEVHANLAKINEDPASYKEAIQSEHRDKWTAAIEEELKSMKDNKRHDR